MSYEGYEQHICKKGHRFDADSSGMFEVEGVCHCGAASAFCNSVDDTNCESWGIILDKDWDRLKLTDAVTEKCPTCEHVKVIEQATYRVPTKEEHEDMRCYFCSGCAAGDSNDPHEADAYHKLKDYDEEDHHGKA